MKLFQSILLAALTMLSCTVFAKEQRPPAFFPIETYGCSYNEGKGLEDFLAVAKAWNKWTNKAIPQSGMAVVLSPYLTTANEIESDVYWMNISPTFETMGLTQDEWLAKGSKMMGKFDEVCSNDSHRMFFGQGVQMSADAPASGMVGFEQCTLKEGASLQKLLAADVKFRAMQDKMKATGANMRWWPMAGVSQQMTADFMNVTGIDSMQSLGKNIDKFMANMDGQAGPYDALVDCTSGNVFTFLTVRAPKQ
jgi:hypothetical protein